MLVTDSTREVRWWEGYTRSQKSRCLIQIYIFSNKLTSPRRTRHGLRIRVALRRFKLQYDEGMVRRTDVAESGVQSSRLMALYRVKAAAVSAAGVCGRCARAERASGLIVSSICQMVARRCSLDKGGTSNALATTHAKWCWPPSSLRARSATGDYSRYGRCSRYSSSGGQSGHLTPRNVCIIFANFTTSLPCVFHVLIFDNLKCSNAVNLFYNF